MHNQIGADESPVRRRQANRSMRESARDDLPVVAKKQRRAKSAVPIEAIENLPPVATKVGRGHVYHAESHVLLAPSDAHNSPVFRAVAQLVRLQKERRFCIKSQSRCDRSVEAFIASQVGYQDLVPASKQDDDAAKKAARTKLFKEISEFRRKVEKEGGGQVASADDGQLGSAALEHVGSEGQASGAIGLNAAAFAPYTHMVIMSAASRQTWDNQRKNVEAAMRKLAAELPVYGFATGVRGLGELGLSIILAETGDLSDYATVEKVWKRLGLAVFQGKAQGRRSNAEEAIENGFAPSRRAEVWAVCSDSMFRHQWRGDKDVDGHDPKKTGKPVAVLAHPIGKYGEVYARRRAATAGREGWSPARQHNDARRIMTKALVEDLWKEWRRASIAVAQQEPKFPLPAVAPLMAAE